MSIRAMLSGMRVVARAVVFTRLGGRSLRRVCFVGR